MLGFREIERSRGPEIQRSKGLEIHLGFEVQKDLEVQKI